MKKVWYIYKDNQNIGQAENFDKAFKRVLAEAGENQTFYNIQTGHIKCANIEAKHEEVKI